MITNLERRYRETESATVREELAKFRSARPCPECQGTRLNRAARNVFIDGKKAITLRGPTVAQDFEKLVIDYIERRFGTGSAGQTAAE